MNRQPIPLPPAKQPSQVTARGHTKAVYLTQEQLRQIIESMRTGMAYNRACYQAGTSHRQFTQRIRREPDLQAEVTEIKRARRARRQKPTVESDT
jgi:hypothetical protein